MQDVFILSDLHGNIPAYTAVVNDIGKTRFLYALKIFVGDYVDFGPWPNEIIDTIRDLENAYFVIGNHDQYLFNDINVLLPDSAVKAKLISHAAWTKSNITRSNNNWIKSLKVVEEIKIDNVDITFFHGNMYKTDEALSIETIESIASKVIIAGHVHKPFIKNCNGKIVINPGSVGEPLDCDTRASYSILHVDEGSIFAEIKRVEYDLSIIENELRRKNVPWKENIIEGFRNARLN